MCSKGAKEDKIEADKEDDDVIDNYLYTPPDATRFWTMEATSRTATPAVQGKGNREETLKEQLGRESDNVTCTSLSTSKENMRRRSEENVQIEPIQGCSALLVSWNPIDYKKNPTQLKDSLLGFSRWRDCCGAGQCCQERTWEGGLKR